MEENSPPKKILIIRNDHIGDMVLSTAVFREIKNAFPNSEVVIIVSKINKQIIEKNRNIDKIIEMEKAEYNLKSILNFLEISKKIKKINFDIGIDLRGSFMNSLLLWISGIKKRIGRTDAHPIIKIFLTNPIQIQRRTHATEDNLQIINEGLNIKAKDKSLEIITDKEDIKEANKFIEKNRLRNYVCLCPVAGLTEKQWPIKNWIDIIRYLKEYNYKLLLFGIESNRKILHELKKENENSEVILNLNLRQMSLIFKKAKLVITQDGGPMHIAWASNAKLIELHNLFIYGMNKVVPKNRSVVLYTKNKDMNSITIEEVEKKITKILN